MPETTATFPLDSFWAIEPLAADRLKAIVESQGIEAMRSPCGFEPGLPVENREGVAVIEISGPMTKRAGVFQILFGGTASTALIQQAVEQAAADPGIGAILLRVDSPGGSVAGLAELSDAVFKARQQKLVWAQVDGMAASAAYHIASQAERIFAGRMDRIGSIGTRLMLFDFSKRFEYLGIKAVPIVTGDYKAAGARGTEITAEQQAYFQGIVSQFFADFLATIVRGRKMSIDAVKAVAEGKIYLAGEAIGLGLIDGIQTFDGGTLAQLQKLVAARRGNGSSAKAGNNRVVSQAATLEQLEAAIRRPDSVEPGFFNDFLCRQLEKKSTVGDATAAWGEQLQHTLKLRQQKEDRIERWAPPGARATGTGAGKEAAAEWDDPVADFNARVSKQVAAGKSRSEALRTVVRADPQLHHAMLQATNSPGLVGEFVPRGRGK